MCGRASQAAWSKLQRRSHQTIDGELPVGRTNRRRIGFDVEHGEAGKRVDCLRPAVVRPAAAEEDGRGQGRSGAARDEQEAAPVEALAVLHVGRLVGHLLGSFSDGRPYRRWDGNRLGRTRRLAREEQLDDATAVQC